MHLPVSTNGAAGNPGTAAAARVLGARGTAGGVLVYDRNADGRFDGDGVADTKVVLIDEFTGKVVARALTDARGHFVFRDMPAGRYEFRAIGPWRLREEGPFFHIVGEQSIDWYQVLVVPGAHQPDPDAPPGTAPQPQGGVAPAQRSGQLASTGADVIGMAIWGLAALFVGLTLLFVCRRRVEI